MRKQDEILALFGRQPPAGQAWLAREIEVLPAYFDSGELVTTVKGLAKDSGQSHVALGAALERLLARDAVRKLTLASGIDPREAGDWTELICGEPPTTGRTTIDPPVDAAQQHVKPATHERNPSLAHGAEGPFGALAHSAAHVLCPVIEALLERLRGDPSILSTIAVALGRFQLPATLSLLSAGLAGRGTVPRAALALGSFGPAGAPPLFEALLSHQQPGFAIPLLYGVRECGKIEDRAVLQQVAERLEPGELGTLALALESFSWDESGDLLERVLASPDPWDVAQACETIRRTGAPEGVILLDRLLRRRLSTFLRCVIVRTVSHIPSDRSREIIQASLGSPAEPLRAVALEAGLRSGFPEDDLRATVDFALQSSSARLKAAGLRVVARLDPRRALACAADLIVNEDRALRLEATHVLGYFPGRRLHGVLSEVGRRDPDPVVRLHAVYSLERMTQCVTAARNVEVFGAFLEDPLVEVRLKAVMALGTVCPAHPTQTLEALRRMALSAPDRKTCIALAGLLGHMASVVDLIYLKEAGPGHDPCVRVAFADGLKRAQREEAALELRALLGDSDPAVKAQAAVGLFRLGDFSGVPILKEVAETPAHLETAAQALEEIGLLVHASWNTKFAGPLLAALTRNLHSQGYGQFHRNPYPGPCGSPRKMVPATAELMPLGSSLPELDEQKSWAVQVGLEQLYLKEKPAVSRPKANDSHSAIRLSLLVPIDRPGSFGLVVAALAVGALLFSAIPYLATVGSPAAPGSHRAVWTGVGRLAPVAGGISRLDPLSTQTDGLFRLCTPHGVVESLTLGFPSNTLTLRPDTCVALNPVGAPQAGSRRFIIEMSLQKGGITVQALTGEPQIKIRTPRMTIGASTSLFMVRVGTDGERLAVITNAVSIVTPRGKLIRATAGQALRITPDGEALGPDPASLRHWRW